MATTIVSELWRESRIPESETNGEERERRGSPKEGGSDCDGDEKFLVASGVWVERKREIERGEGDW